MRLIKLNDLPQVGVSHNIEIKKKVIIENGYIPKITTFGQATFLPGQKVEEHTHKTMFEVFYIQSGSASFVVSGQKTILHENECICIEPNEPHSQENPFSEPVTWLYFGVATD